MYDEKVRRLAGALPAHLEQLRHHLHGILRPLRRREEVPLLYAWFLAKRALAFFRNSFSILSRSFSLLSLAISLSSSVMPDPVLLPS